LDVFPLPTNALLIVPTVVFVVPHGFPLLVDGGQGANHRRRRQRRPFSVGQSMRTAQQRFVVFSRRQLSAYRFKVIESREFLIIDDKKNVSGTATMKR
jgi:hypothetical protein